jgi:hypothetical protein
MRMTELFNQHSPRLWWHKAQLFSYAEALALFKKAKKPSEGKPFRSWARLYMRGENIHLYYGNNTGVEIGYFSPDDKFTFTSTPHLIRNTCAHTLAASLYAAIPFMWQRVGLGRYRVEHTAKIPVKKKDDVDRPWVEWSHMRTNAPEYFEGIQFDLATGECTNRKPDVLANVNTDARKQWLSSLRKFKYGIKARARISTFDNMIEQAKRDGNRSIPDWSADTWLDMLYTSIKNNEYPIELLRGISAYAVWHGHWYKPANITSADIPVAVQEICNTYSINLRKRFGVFDEVSEVQKDNEVSRHKMEGDRADQGQAMAM